MSITATHAQPSRPGSDETGIALGEPRLLLRLEGALMLVAATTLYASVGGSWLLYGLLFLVPDLFMLGYLKGPRLGAALYNAGHSYALPALLYGIGVLTSQSQLTAVALIWLAHIGFDRAVGYGLKYPDRFRHTHLGG